jgi:hypothetical protein
LKIELLKKKQEMNLRFMDGFWESLLMDISIYLKIQTGRILSISIFEFHLCKREEVKKMPFKRTARSPCKNKTCTDEAGRNTGETINYRL